MIAGLLTDAERVTRSKPVHYDERLDLVLTYIEDVKRQMDRMPPCVWFDSQNKLTQAVDLLKRLMR